MYYVGLLTEADVVVDDRFCHYDKICSLHVILRCTVISDETD